MRIWMLMKDGQRLVRKVIKKDNIVPTVGDIYSFHIEGLPEPEMWKVAAIHRDLYPGGALDAGEPFDRVDINEVYEGSSIVVILEWEVKP